MNSVASPYFAESKPRAGQCSNLDDLRTSQPSHWVTLSLEAGWTPASTSFVSAIGIVDARRTKEEMCWVDTSTVVASMENAEANWNRPIRKFVGESVRLQDLPPVLDVAVAVTDVALPFVAITNFAPRMGPETVLERHSAPVLHDSIHHPRLSCRSD